MSNSLSASKKVMKNYLSELLTEESPLPAVSHNKSSMSKPSASKEKELERLLQKVSVVEQKPIVEQKSSVSKKDLPKKTFSKRSVKENIKEPVLTTAKAQGNLVTHKKKDYRDGDFQAMFIDVAGLLIAVPLIELGGIHNVEKTTPLMGKPSWFSGVMVYRDEKINVVDTALWVMPEKCDQKLKNSLNYQYIIMLSNSCWGLSAEKLVDTVVLKQHDVKWLDSPSKRPWLAGLVKDRMCALLDVDSLIKLLEEGMGNG